MHFSAFVLPLMATLAAASEKALANPRMPNGVSLARSFRRETSDLSRRTDVDPEVVCGSNFVDCASNGNDGFCCSSGQTCDGELYGYPVCKDPTATDGILQGTAAATPYKNIEGVLSSLTAALGSMTDMTALPTATGTGSGSSDATTTKAAGAQATSAQATGGAALSVKGGMGGLGAIVAVWGVAALGGAGWLLA